MSGNMEVAALLVLFVTELTLGGGDTVNSILNRKDLCTSLCENTPIDSSNSMYVKSCCQRGCRFFNLVDLRYGWERDSLNGTRSACEASCTEAYINLNDRYVCNTGCNFMAKQRISNLLPLFTITICIEENMDILPMSPDMPDNDILTDPGLRKELFPRWWDADGFKLPQTHIKTIPMDARTVDYTLSSDYFEETKQPASTSKSESFQRKMKRVKNISVLHVLCFAFGKLYILFFPMIIYATLYFAIKMEIWYRNRPYKNISSSKNIMLPQEVIIYKVPPPKRHRLSLHQSFDMHTSSIFVLN